MSGTGGGADADGRAGDGGAAADTTLAGAAALTLVNARWCIRRGSAPGNWVSLLDGACGHLSCTGEVGRGRAYAPPLPLLPPPLLPSTATPVEVAS